MQDASEIHRVMNETFASSLLPNYLKVLWAQYLIHHFLTFKFKASQCA